MTDYEVMQFEGEFWGSPMSHKMSFEPNQVDRANKLSTEWGIDWACDFDIQSWFALLVSEAVK